MKWKLVITLLMSVQPFYLLVCIGKTAREEAGSRERDSGRACWVSKCCYLWTQKHLRTLHLKLTRNREDWRHQVQALVIKWNIRAQISMHFSHLYYTAHSAQYFRKDHFRSEHFFYFCVQQFVPEPQNNKDSINLESMAKSRSSDGGFQSSLQPKTRLHRLLDVEFVTQLWSD